MWWNHQIERTPYIELYLRGPPKKVPPCLKMERAPAPETPCYIKKLEDEQSPPPPKKYYLNRNTAVDMYAILLKVMFISLYKSVIF